MSDGRWQLEGDFGKQIFQKESELWVPKLHRVALIVLRDLENLAGYRLVDSEDLKQIDLFIPLNRRC